VQRVAMSAESGNECRVQRVAVSAGSGSECRVEVCSECREWQCAVSAGSGSVHKSGGKLDQSGINMRTAAEATTGTHPMQHYLSICYLNSIHTPYSPKW
jgi:hypothetical protein